MLPKQYRLPLRTEFKRIKKEGKLFPGRFFSLLVSHQPPLGPSLGARPATPRTEPRGEASYQPPRLAFIISKKIHKKAIKRNRVRRLLVEAVRGILPKIKPGFDFVFLVKKTILEKKLLEIKNEVEKFFGNEKIYSFFD